MEKYVTKFVFANQSRLYGASWEITNPVANVIVITGMEEHALRYTDFALFLNKAQMSVFTIDYFGQGENITYLGHKKGVVPHGAFELFVGHIKELAIKLKGSKLPLYVIGHSMGSFLTQRLLQVASEYFAKAVIIGSNGPDPAFAMGKIASKITVTKKNWEKTSKLLSSLSIQVYAKSVKNAKTPADWISRNPANVEAYINNPLDGGPSSKGFYYELLHGTGNLYTKAAFEKVRRNLPLLFLAGKEDPVGHFGKGVSKLHKFYFNLGFTNTKLEIYENMRHEILNEVEKKTVYDDILSFLLQ